MEVEEKEEALLSRMKTVRALSFEVLYAPSYVCILKALDILGICLYVLTTRPWRSRLFIDPVTLRRLVL